MVVPSKLASVDDAEWTPLEVRREICRDVFSPLHCCSQKPETMTCTRQQSLTVVQEVLQCSYSSMSCCGTSLLWWQEWESSKSKRNLSYEPNRSKRAIKKRKKKYNAESSDDDSEVRLAQHMSQACH